MDNISLEQYIDMYVEKFNQSFPYFLIRGTSKEEMIQIIKDCLKTGNPYEPEILDGCLY